MSIQKNYQVNIDLSQNGQGISVASTSVSSQQVAATTFLTGPAGAPGPQGAPGTNGVDGAPGPNTVAGLITAGTNVTITGAGTSASPFNISSANNGVQSVNTRSGNVTLTKADVGLDNVDNTSDANKPVSNATQTALNAKQPTLVSGTNIKTINGNSLLGAGDLVISGGGGGGGAVTSVAGRTGDVVLTKSDVGLANVDNTSDADKPVSTATQAALDGKEPTITTLPVSKGGTGTSIFTPLRFLTSNADGTSTTTNKGIPSGLVVGTSDTQTLTNKTITAPLGIVKADVGLGNVDNTSDANKPVSTAQQAALDLKKNDSITTNRLLGRGTAGTGVIEEITLGTGLSLSGTTLNATGSGGFSNPMTTAGDIIYGGTGGAPTRLAAGTGFLRAGSTPSYSVVSLTTDVTGTLPVGSGGTGTTTSTGTGNTVLSASPTFTGTPIAPTATAGTNTTQIATTAFSAAAISAERTATRTLTNARITQRVTTLAGGTTYTPVGDTSDLVTLAAPTGAWTLNAPTGTPTNGQRLQLRITTGTTAFTPTYNAIYISGGATLPTTFTPSSTRNLLFVYDTTLVKWVLEADDGIPTISYFPMQLKAYRRVSAAATITATDGFISADATSAAFSVTLPAANTVGGQRFTVKKWNTNTNDITVVGTIDGAANHVLSGSTRPSMDFVSNGTDWEKA